jgi:hypothetical protein
VTSALHVEQNCAQQSPCARTAAIICSSTAALRSGKGGLRITATGFCMRATWSLTLTYSGQSLRFLVALHAKNSSGTSAACKVEGVKTKNACQENAILGTHLLEASKDEGWAVGTMRKQSVVVVQGVSNKVASSRRRLDLHLPILNSHLPLARRANCPLTRLRCRSRTNGRGSSTLQQHDGHYAKCYTFPLTLSPVTAVLWSCC